MPPALRVDIAASFDARLQALEAFLLMQDREAAPSRRRALHDEILHVIEQVKRHPELGRPAAMLAAASVEGRCRLETVLRQAVDAGLPSLREYVMAAHIVLYAHSETRILLLSIRHQRELGYMPAASAS